MLIKEAIHVISCGYEEKTEWDKEVNPHVLAPCTCFSSLEMLIFFINEIIYARRCFLENINKFLGFPSVLTRISCQSALSYFPSVYLLILVKVLRKPIA